MAKFVSSSIALRAARVAILAFVIALTLVQSAGPYLVSDTRWDALTVCGGVAVVAFSLALLLLRERTSGK